MAKIEIFRQQAHGIGPVAWDIYIDHHFLDRYARLGDAKSRAETRAGGLGRWRKKPKSAFAPVRFVYEEKPA